MVIFFINSFCLTVFCPARGNGSFSNLFSKDDQCTISFAKICNCSGRCSFFSTTCSIDIYLASPTSGGSSGLLVNASAFHCNHFGQYTSSWSKLNMNVANRASLRLISLCVMKFSKLVWPISGSNIWVAPLHSGLPSLSSIKIAISSLTLIL